MEKYQGGEGRKAEIRLEPQPQDVLLSSKGATWPHAWDDPSDKKEPIPMDQSSNAHASKPKSVQLCFFSLRFVLARSLSLEISMSICYYLTKDS